MKKQITILIILISIFFMGCGDERPYNDYEYAFPYLEFSQRSYLVGIMRMVDAQIFAYKTIEDEIMPHQILWRSSNPLIASIDQFGTITGVAEGSCKIYAQYDLLIDSAFVTIIPEEICSLRIEPHEKFVTRGVSFNYAIRYFNFSGIEVFPPLEPIWASSNEEVAYVTEDGLCQVSNLGSTIITASVYDIADTAYLNVINYDPEGDILPIANGNFWKFQRERIIDAVTYTDTVTMIFAGDTSLTTTTTSMLKWRKNGEFFGKTQYLFKGDLGVYAAGYRENDTLAVDVYSRPILWRKYPAMINDQYNTFEAYSHDSVRIKVRNTSTSFSTPGGNFNCFEYYTTNNVYSEEMYYFAPNIGMVGYLAFDGGRLKEKLQLIDYGI